MAGSTSTHETGRSATGEQSGDLAAREAADDHQHEHHPDHQCRDEEKHHAMQQLGLPREVMPRHVAIIMDGNGRWAQRQGHPRIFGHEQGAKTVRHIVTECARLELDALTLFGFSSENWKRPAEEVNFLMHLYIEYLVARRDEMMQNNIRFHQIGRRDGLPGDVLAEIDRTVAITSSNTGLNLVLAINYGGRAEITDAVRAIAHQVASGEIRPDEIDEATVAANLYTAGLPDPDLLIRTAGEMRVSNYLLWQISFAELYVADCCWPDFSVDEFRQALRSYAQRHRRFGALVDKQPRHL